MQRRGIFSLLIIFAFTTLIPFNAFSASWSQVGNVGFGLGNVVQDANQLAVFNNKLYSCTRGWSGNWWVPQLFVYNTGTSWTQVNMSSVKTDPYNEFCGEIQVFNNTLIIGVDNSTTGTELWSWDGGVWTQINSDGFGDRHNWYTYRIRVWNGKLYASTYNPSTGGEVWEYSGSGTTWTQVNTNGFGNSNNLTAHAYVANNKLYASTRNIVTGTEIYAYSGAGTSWTQINTPGFGDGSLMLSSAVVGFNNDLYAATSGGSDTKVWKYAGAGTAWTQVNIDGFGDFNNRTSNLFSLNNQLYAATDNILTGAEVWLYSGSGTTWTQENTDGFGDPDNEMILSMVLFQNLIYAGTINVKTGAEVWATAVITPTPTPTPTPAATISGNGSKGPLSITTSDTLSVKVSLNANGYTTTSDWWCVYSDPNNQWRYLDLTTSSFQTGVSVTYQGALFDLGAYQVFNSALSSPGTYTFYFGVDTIPDGSVSMSAVYYDTLVVNAQ